MRLISHIGLFSSNQFRVNPVEILSIPIFENLLFIIAKIKLLKCEEIGIFCRNFAEKFILKFAKLFYIKKHEDSCHSPAQFVISNKK